MGCMHAVIAFMSKERMFTLQRCNKLCYEEIVPRSMKSWKLPTFEKRCFKGLNDKLIELKITTYFFEFMREEHGELLFSFAEPPVDLPQ